MQIEESDLVGFTDAPSADESKDLTTLGRELFTTDQQIKDTQATLEQLSARREELVRRVLPDYMTRVGQDKIGLPEFNVDLVMEPYVHANIAKDWEPERREVAFEWLVDNNEGDLIKCVLSIEFPRTLVKLARWLQGMLDALKPPAEFEDTMIPDSNIEMTVPWNTLTAWAKRKIADGEKIPLDVLGVTYGQIVKIKERNVPKKARK